MTQPVFRFAPSPNGYLHLGHAYSALLNHDMATASGGRFLLRFEDIDTIRCHPHFIQAAIEDLNWLGIAWEQPVRRQSEHFGDYKQALDRLRRMGLVYPAFLTRSQIADVVKTGEASGIPWPRDPDGAPIYPGHERSASQIVRAEGVNQGGPFAWRLNMKQALEIAGTQISWTEAGGGTVQTISANAGAWGDVLLARKDSTASYHLSVVFDDALQEVTDVVRGQDLWPATSIHRLLQELLGLPPPRYHHHRLLLNENGRKLAKSAMSKPLRQLRKEGVEPDEVRKMTGLSVRQIG